MAFFSCCRDKSPMQCWRVITLPLLNCWVCTILNSADLRGFTARTWVRSADTLCGRSHAARSRCLTPRTRQLRCYFEVLRRYAAHITSFTPLTDFAALLRLLSEGDELLLLQDGVTAAVDGNRYLESLRNAPIKVYALNEDLIARGLTGRISNDIIPIDYTDFVRLTVKHSSQMAR